MTEPEELATGEAVALTPPTVSAFAGRVKSKEMRGERRKLRGKKRRKKRVNRIKKRVESRREKEGKIGEKK